METHAKGLNYTWLAFGCIVCFYVLWHFLFPEYWVYTIGPWHLHDAPFYPFLDMHGRVAAYEAWSHGFDVIRNPNPLDPMGRISVKPSWGLPISSLGLHREGLAFAGSAVVVSSLAVFISMIRPKQWGEVVVAFLLVCSSGIMLGIERANDDLVYFSILALVPLILKKRQPVRYWLAWLIIFMIAPAKFYPGAAFAVFLVDIRSRRLMIALLTAGVVFICVYAFSAWEELLFLRNAVPEPLIMSINGLAIPYVHLFGSKALSYLFAGLLLGSGLWHLLHFCRREQPCVRSLSLWSRQYFIIGSSTYTFCFLLNSNFDYRFILLIFTLPVFFELGFRNVWGRFWASVSRLTLLGLLVVFWIDIIVCHSVLLAGHLDVLIDVMITVSALKNILLYFIMFSVVGVSSALLAPSIRSMSPEFWKN
jgi:hypothetical protein